VLRPHPGRFFGCALKERSHLSLEAPDRLNTSAMPRRALRSGLLHQYELANLGAQLLDIFGMGAVLGNGGRAFIWSKIRHGSPLAEQEIVDDGTTQ
jgi:hypothetical protein